MSNLLGQQAEQLFRDNEDLCFGWLHLQQQNMNSLSVWGTYKTNFHELTIYLRVQHGPRQKKLKKVSGKQSLE